MNLQKKMMDTLKLGKVNTNIKKLCEKRLNFFLTEQNKAGAFLNIIGLIHEYCIKQMMNLEKNERMKESRSFVEYMVIGRGNTSRF